MSAVTRKLNALPDDPREIADFLQRKGIRGQRYNAHSCPIAKYLGHDVTVSEEGITTFWRRIPVPPAVRQFILQFDQGYYENLNYYRGLWKLGV